MKTKTILITVGAALGAALLIACGSPSPSTPGRAVGVTTPPHPTDAAIATKYAAPVAADFTLVGKVKSQQCFGSAGCNVEVDPLLTYVGKGAEPNSSWEITFNAVGDESGPITATLSVTFDGTGKAGNFQADSILASTKARKDVPLTFTITSVDSTNG